MEKIVQQGILYDFYGELLTEHQKQIYEAFVNENMSLVEIADEQGISRQAVYDLIKRTDKILLDYENKLGLIKRFEIIREKINEANDKLGKLHELSESSDRQIVEIHDIFEQIMDIM